PTPRCIPGNDDVDPNDHALHQSREDPSCDRRNSLPTGRRNANSEKFCLMRPLNCWCLSQFSSLVYLVSVLIVFWDFAPPQRTENAKVAQSKPGPYQTSCGAACFTITARPTAVNSEMTRPKT